MSSAPSSLDVFRAVADPTRRALLDCLRETPPNPSRALFASGFISFE
jgi:hypothetical protein